MKLRAKARNPATALDILVMFCLLVAAVKIVVVNALRIVHRDKVEAQRQKPIATD